MPTIPPHRYRVFLLLPLGLSLFMVVVIVGAQLRSPIVVLGGGLIHIFTTYLQGS